MNFKLRDWVIFALIILVILFLNACAVQPAVDRYKIIEAKPVVKTKVVTKRVSKKCPKLPPLAKEATPSERNQHHIKVIEMYVECAK